MAMIRATRSSSANLVRDGVLQAAATERGGRPQRLSTLFVLGCAIGGIAILTLVSTQFVRWLAPEGHVSAAERMASLATAVNASRMIQFADRADGSFVVTESPSGGVVAVMPPESNHFIRSIMRSLVRERKTLGLTSTQPFQLARDPRDGRLSLTDMATGRKLELHAFGPANFGAFATLLDGPVTAPTNPKKPE
jgi:putative photosynthetic complex assembly protein